MSSLTPSSQASPASLKVSPQIGVQIERLFEFSEHSYPVIIPEQSDRHPFPSFVLPSSHTSDEFLATIPSPQVVEQTEGEVEVPPEHYQPG